MASTATETEPSVPFLKPIGNDTPDASSRWSWDSVVRAPMAPQEIKSAMNWGGDGIEELGPDGDTTVGELAEQVASNAETLVDLERAINVGVVDQTLPADSRARLLAVGGQ